MIPGAGGGNVEQMALGVVGILKIGGVSLGVDAFLQRDDLIVTGQDCDNPLAIPTNVLFGSYTKRQAVFSARRPAAF